jgi:hypothetical protein
MTKEVQITFDCADPAGLAAFWAEALGYQVQPPPGGFDSWGAALEASGVPRDQWNSRSAILPIEGPHPRVFFQRVPEGKTVKNRLHLDVRVAPGLEGDERRAPSRPRPTVWRRSVRLAPIGSSPTSRRWSPASSRCTIRRATSSASTNGGDSGPSSIRQSGRISFVTMWPRGERPATRSGHRHEGSRSPQADR